MITYSNYKEQTGKLDLTKSPQVLQDTHNAWDELIKYKDDPSIRETLDLYLEKINAWVAKQAPAKKTETAKPPRSTKKRGPSTGKKSTRKKKSKTLEERQKELSELLPQVQKALSDGKMTQAEVLAIAQKINATRRLAAQRLDKKSDHVVRLSPTFDNLKRWAKNPGKYDLVGVDTRSKESVTKEFKGDYTPKKRSWWDTFWNGNSTQ